MYKMWTNKIQPHTTTLPPLWTPRNRESMIEITVKITDLEVARKLLRDLSKHQEGKNNQTLLIHPEGPATEKQLAFMETLGIPVPDGCTKQQAHDMIEKHKENNQ